MEHPTVDHNGWNTVLVIVGNTLMVLEGMGTPYFTNLSSMELSWYPRQQVLRWKYSLDQSHTFKGPPNIHLVRSIIVKACEARMDPIEDMPDKKISPPSAGWGAIHDGKNMGSGITIWCHGNGSNIGDYKLSLPKSRLQPKFQGWARLSKVLKIVAKSKSQSENLSLLSSLHF